MATESPIRILETGAKWSTSSANMAVEELGLPQKGHNFHGSGRNAVPDRSGSAPPNMESSLLAIDNLISQQNTDFSVSLANLNATVENFVSEEYLQTGPTYLTYYQSNANLNPRLPRHNFNHMNRFGTISSSSSTDDVANSSFHLSQVSFSTHKEESEDDRSPQHSVDDLGGRTNGLWSRKDAAQLAGQNKNFVDTMQEDFPCTSSHVYDQSHSLGYEMTVEAVGHNSNSSTLQDLSVSSSNAARSTIDTDSIMVASKANLSAAHISSSSSCNSKGTLCFTPSTNVGTLNDSDVWLKDEVSVSVSNAEVTVLGSYMKDLTVSPQNSGNQINQDQCQAYQEESSSSQVRSATSQLGSQGVIGTYFGMDQFHQGPSRFSTVVQPVLQSSVFTPPLYATEAVYMTSLNPFYPNVQAPGFYSPQYGLGGYANSSVVPPFIARYPPHGAVPVVSDGAAGPNFSTQASRVSGGAVFVHGSDAQHLSKFYGQVGFALQPSFADPFHLQYFQQPFGQAYNVSGQSDPSTSGSGVFGNQNIAYLQKVSDIAASDDQKFQNQRSTGPSNSNSGKGVMSPHYLGNPPHMGISVQYPSSAIASPVLPGSPLVGAGFPCGRNEMSFLPSSGRYSGWHSQRGYENFNDPKIYNFLEELKSGKGRRFELSDIAGHIVKFSADQHGSRFIQQKLESCSGEEKSAVFKEVIPHASKLMTDVFGNYVIQKFFEYGSTQERKELANQLVGQILPLSLQMYGCRVIQKALEVIELEQKVQLVCELDGHILRCVRDQNGNHVIQKCIESIPTEKIEFIISAFRGQVATLSMHPYGCRVIQRILEQCTDESQCQFIVEEILDSVCGLAQDQYGNYVTQHVLEQRNPLERSKIIGKLSGHIVQLSQHKFASNVIEKCFEYGGTAERALIIDEIVGQNEGHDNLLIMMKDQFANYVVQKIFEICTDSQRAMLLSRIRAHAHALKKYTYGKHIVARFEMLLEDNQ
ncbi:pumilio homolog 6, chloroplastic-like isoform X2 [Mangifera indica]|uniref:pumilio homolog 6, chloroplastic-like isoform X2 n=1 Tax=Mangifera indica TaxID=29780 RepID=UPI001CFB4335|nr:pumilio homolog 6, chloroplastic-like isoform X2 [Mangifera indica]